MRNLNDLLTLVALRCRWRLSKGEENRFDQNALVAEKAVVAVEVGGEDQLEGELVGGRGQAEAGAEFHRHRPDVMVHHRVELMRLLVPGQETTQLTEIVIFLGGDGPAFGDLEIQPRRGSEIEPRKSHIAV